MSSIRKWIDDFKGNKEEKSAGSTMFSTNLGVKGTTLNDIEQLRGIDKDMRIEHECVKVGPEIKDEVKEAYHKRCLLSDLVTEPSSLAAREPGSKPLPNPSEAAASHQEYIQNTHLRLHSNKMDYFYRDV